MKLFVETQTTKMGQVFRMEEKEVDPDDETDDIILENDGDYAPSIMVNIDAAGTSNSAVKLIPPVIVSFLVLLFMFLSMGKIDIIKGNFTGEGRG